MFFFPIPYPDELFYSIIARYNVMAGNHTAIHTVEDLFQTRSAVSTIEFPSRLNMLNLALPDSIQLDVLELIERNTLLNFYCAFKSAEIKDNIIAMMLNSEGKGIHTRLGLVSGSVNFHKYLRFCPLCFDKDLENHGNAYWHRTHQIAGVFSCSTHKMLTQNSNILKNQPNRQIWEELRLTNISTDNQSEDYSTQTMKHMETYVEYAKFILENPHSKSIKWIKNRYNIILFEKGYVRLNNYTKIVTIIDDLKEYFTDEYLMLMECGENFNWIKNILVYGGKNPDATRHLLLLQFLRIHPRDFFNISYDLDNVDIKSYFQSVWDEKLIELIKMGKSQREICKILTTTRKTIIGATERLGISTEWKDRGGRRYTGRYGATEEFSEKRKEMMKFWEQWHKQNPNLSSYAIRKNHDHVYAWLKKYNNEWMKVRYIKKDNTSTERVNWSERDKKLYLEARNVVEVMKVRENERITLGRVATYLNIKGWIDKKKDKIPDTMGYLSNEIETVDDFHKRKLMQTYNKMKSEAVITFNSLFEASKINYRYKEKHRKYGEKLILEKVDYE